MKKTRYSSAHIMRCRQVIAGNHLPGRREEMA